MSESIRANEISANDWINSILKRSGIESLSFSKAQCELLDLMFDNYPKVFAQMLKLIISDVIPFYNKCTAEVDELQIGQYNFVSKEDSSPNAQKNILIQLPNGVLRRAGLIPPYKEKLLGDLRYELRLMLRMTIDEMITFACYDCDPVLRRYSQSSFDDGVYLVGKVRDLQYYKAIVEKGNLELRLRKLYQEQFEYGSSFLGIKNVPSNMRNRLGLIIYKIDSQLSSNKITELGPSRFLDNYGRGD